MRPTPTILLIASAPPAAREIIAALSARPHGCAARAAASARAGLQRLAAEPADCAVIDCGPDSLECLHALRRRLPELPVVLLAPPGAEGIGIEAIKLGAADCVIRNGTHLPRLRLAVREAIGRRLVERALEESRPGADGGRLVPALSERWRRAGFVGQSAAIERVLELADRAARSRATVLLEGETGTGKDLLARAIHHHGPRAEAPYLALNCAALPDTLFESELFGHEKGAFTGADRARPGLF
jgi:DNA-binding NtrC family response regulator